MSWEIKRGRKGTVRNEMAVGEKRESTGVGTSSRDELLLGTDYTVVTLCGKTTSAQLVEGASW